MDTALDFLSPVLHKCRMVFFYFSTGRIRIFKYSHTYANVWQTSFASTCHNWYQICDFPQPIPEPLDENCSRTKNMSIKFCATVPLSVRAKIWWMSQGWKVTRLQLPVIMNVSVLYQYEQQKCFSFEQWHFKGAAAVTWKSYGPMVPFWEDLFGFILAYKEQKQDSKISTFSATSPSYWKVFIHSAQVQH